MTCATQHGLPAQRLDQLAAVEHDDVAVLDVFEPLPDRRAVNRPICVLLWP